MNHGSNLRVKQPWLFRRTFWYVKVSNHFVSLLTCLQGIPEDMLKDKLLSRVMRTGGFGSRRGSNYNVPMNVQQATNNRDALAKVCSSTASKNLSNYFFAVTV